MPLHGRLFAQWMHHAFPRHCPFPHVSGTAERQSLSKFQAERHERAAFADYKEMKELSEEPLRRRRVESDFGMWSEEEELIDPAGNLKKARSDRTNRHVLGIVIVLYTSTYRSNYHELRWSLGALGTSLCYWWPPWRCYGRSPRRAPWL